MSRENTGIEAIVFAIQEEFRKAHLPCSFLPDSKNPVGKIYWTLFEEKQKKPVRLVFKYYADLMTTVINANDLRKIFHETMAGEAATHFLPRFSQKGPGVIAIELQFSLTHQWMRSDFYDDFMNINFCRILPLRALFPFCQPESKAAVRLPPVEKAEKKPVKNARMTLFDSKLSRAREQGRLYLTPEPIATSQLMLKMLRSD